ncbi:hypothetical protein [Streptomyces sp. NBC_00620]|uniref:hypothetical protein n=1 Tax=Streptomyces sp. NBC_00620 TaxID=2903666 RepID=UPI002256CEA9|nr:hypothetical protein [Streptomyces sp. NBC_00620]MCX4976439.1 hypothetical protein [Streptomyces sp. NBC_00620]
MATNTTRRTADAPDEAAVDTAETRSERNAPSRAVPVVGPPLREGEEPSTVTLSHHLGIDGTDYAPGTEISVSSDYARRLRGQGFVART